MSPESKVSTPCADYLTQIGFDHREVCVMQTLLADSTVTLIHVSNTTNSVLTINDYMLFSLPPSTGWRCAVSADNCHSQH